MHAPLLERPHMSRSKAGRKRFKELARTTSGQLSRSRKARLARKEDSERSAIEVAVDARQRHYGMLGVPVEYYKDPRMGSALGRLSIAYDIDVRAGRPEHLRSGITRDQMDAAEKFAETRLRYFRAVGAPGLPRQPRSEDDPPKACDRCGLMIPCEDCAADKLGTARRAWREVTELLAARSSWLDVVRDLVIYDIFDPDDILILRPALDALDAYYRKGTR